MNIQDNQSLNEIILRLTEENLSLKKHVEYLSNLQSIKIQLENQINSLITANCLLRDTIETQQTEFITSKDKKAQSLQDYYLELIQKLRNNAVELERISSDDCKKQNTIQELQIELRCNYIDFVDKYQQPYICYLTEQLENLMTELKVNSNELINVNNNYSKLLSEKLNLKSQCQQDKKTIRKLSLVIQKFQKKVNELEADIECIRPTKMRGRRIIDTAQRLQLENEHFIEQIHLLHEKLNLYQKQNEELQQTLQQKNLALKVSTQNNDIQNNEVGGSLQNQQLLQSQLNEKFEQKKEKLNEQSQQQRELFQLKKKQCELENEIKEFNEINENLNEIIQQLQIENQRLGCELYKYQFEQDPKTLLLELDSANAEIDIQIQENQSLNTQLMNLKQQNQIHEKNIFQNCQKINQQENNIYELNNLIIKYECEIQQVKAQNSYLNRLKTIQE